MTTKRTELTAAVLAALRDAAAQMRRLNHAVGSKVALNSTDIECLDLIAREGPMTPSDLAAAKGLAPATLTGILDRLEDGGWVERVRDRVNRRRVLVQALRKRGPELSRLYRPMATAMEELCGKYNEAELAMIADFLKKVDDAGRSAVDGRPRR